LTAIGAWLNEENPVLVGDLAVSGNEGSRPAVVPTIRSVGKQFPPGSGYVVNGTHRKVCVIGEHLAVAWTGPVVAAAEALELLREYCGARCDAAKLTEALRQMSSSKVSEELVLIGWVRDDGRWRNFRFEAMALELDQALPQFCGLGG
jgi:hypothetical protein